MILVPKASTISLTNLRTGIQKCLEAVIPTAVIYNNWAMKYGLEETVSLLTGPEGYVHAWLISVNNIDEGLVRTGAGTVELPLNIRIWGFLGDSFGGDTGSRQDTIEKECLSAIKVLLLNQMYLGMEPRPDNPLMKVGILKFTDIDVKPFGSGSDIIVAEGNIEVTWRDQVQ